eukprot:1146638-Pelagomonas_calceolata.AAC.1
MGKELTCKLGSPLVVTAFLLEISAGLASSVVTSDYLSLSILRTYIPSLEQGCKNSSKQLPSSMIIQPGKRLHSISLLALHRASNHSIPKTMHADLMVKQGFSLSSPSLMLARIPD